MIQTTPNNDATEGSQPTIANTQRTEGSQHDCPLLITRHYARNYGFVVKSTHASSYRRMTRRTILTRARAF